MTGLPQRTPLTPGPNSTERAHARGRCTRWSRREFWLSLLFGAANGRVGGPSNSHWTGRPESFASGHSIARNGIRVGVGKVMRSFNYLESESTVLLQERRCIGPIRAKELRISRRNNGQNCSMTSRPGIKLSQAELPAEVPPWMRQSRRDRARHGFQDRSHQVPSDATEAQTTPPYRAPTTPRLVGHPVPSDRDCGLGVRASSLRIASRRRGCGAR